MPKVSVAMISMNEEEIVARVVEEVRASLPDAEIIIVDSSKDKTAEIAEARGAKVIKQFPPKGFSKAMELVLTSASGDIIVTMDCDGTYPSTYIPLVVKLIEEDGYDLVNTTRVLKKPKSMPFGNFIANRVFALLTWIRHGIKTTDVHSGMRAYKRNVIHSLKWNLEGPALPVELFIKSVKHGFKFIEIPIPYYERVGKSTLNKLDSTIWTLKRIFCKKYYY